MDFQLHNHDCFLAPFREVFQLADSDGDGILNEREFRSLLNTICPSTTENEVIEMLNSVDKHDKGIITFSQVKYK